MSEPNFRACSPPLAWLYAFQMNLFGRILRWIVLGVSLCLTTGCTGGQRLGGPGDLGGPGFRLSDNCASVGEEVPLEEGATSGWERGGDFAWGGVENYVQPVVQRVVQYRSDWGNAQRSGGVTERSLAREIELAPLTVLPVQHILPAPGVGEPFEPGWITQPNPQGGFEPGMGTEVMGGRPLSFAQDYDEVFARFQADFRAVTRWENFAYLGFAIGGTVLAHELWDDDVRADTFEHPKRWNGFSEVLENMGQMQVQFPVLLALYGYSLQTQDEGLHSLSLALFSAYKFAGGGSWAIKLITDTERPSDGYYHGHWGFPSDEAATSFALAAVLEEYYGWGVGVPAYSLAGLISWSTIDLRDQDVSDVVFGAAFGLILGKTIGRRHFEEEYSWQVVPFPSTFGPATGLGLETRY